MRKQPTPPFVRCDSAAATRPQQRGRSCGVFLPEQKRSPLASCFARICPQLRGLAVLIDRPGRIDCGDRRAEQRKDGSALPVLRPSQPLAFCVRLGQKRAHRSARTGRHCANRASARQRARSRRSFSPSGQFRGFPDRGEHGIRRALVGSPPDFPPLAAAAVARAYRRLWRDCEPPLNKKDR